METLHRSLDEAYSQAQENLRGPDSQEAQQQLNNINTLRTEYRSMCSNAGISMSNIRVNDDLPDNVGGIYKVPAQEVEIHAEVISNAIAGTREDIKKALHVGSHEIEGHAQIDANRRKEGAAQIQDIKVEEVIADETAKRKSGERLAYKEYNSAFARIRSVSGKTRNQLIDLALEGNTEEINQYIAEASR